MHIGGVQKALISLLCAIKDKYDVTLLLFSPVGEYMKDIPQGVKVISPNSDYKYIGKTKYDVQGKPVELFKRSFYAGITRIFGRKFALKIMSIGQKKITGYDVAISYLHNSKEKGFYGGCNDFVLNCVDSPKKVAFLHCDYGKSSSNTKENALQYAKFDVIASCSKGCGKTFAEVLPHLKEKVVAVDNCHNFEEIKAKAQEGKVDLSGDYINIVTVARLGSEKGVTRAVEAVAQLGELKDKIKYYIVGDGSKRSEIERVIAEKNLQKTVILCGSLSNPYGYMQASDFLLIPSYNEAAPLVIGEAASLGTPILSTKTSSATDMIIDTGFGWVCDNSCQGIVDCLTELLQNKDAIFEKKEYLKSISFDNSNAIYKFDEIINI